MTSSGRVGPAAHSLPLRSRCGGVIPSRFADAIDRGFVRCYRGTRQASLSAGRCRSANSEGHMSKLLRGIAAGYGAKKLGGGCLTTILVFILLWWLLGNFEVFR
jgi:hypothetical protein